MKKEAIVFSMFAIVASASAQEGSDSVSTPKIIQEQNKRNEISINTAPLFRVLLNSGSSQATRFSATYKRNLNDRSAFRFSLMADLINNDSYYMNPWNDVIIMQSDSVLIKQVTVSQRYLSPHINIGYERLFGKHKLKWFYGADLSVGYLKNHSYRENKTLVRDTSQGPNAWVEAQTLRADIVSKTDKKIFSIGISPFFGAKFPISKRLSISAQVGVDMAFRKENVTETIGVTTKKYNVSTFDFNQNTGILNDISLIYKF